MTIEAFIRLLRRDANDAGGQKRLAQRIVCSESSLSNVLNGRRDPSEKILSYYGLAVEKQIVKARNDKQP